MTLSVPFGSLSSRHDSNQMKIEGLHLDRTLSEILVGEEFLLYPEIISFMRLHLGREPALTL